MYLAKSFTVTVKPVQKSDVVVTGKPFIPPVHKTTRTTGQMKATQPVDAPDATTVMQPTCQDVSYQIAANRPKVQLPGLAS